MVRTGREREARRISKDERKEGVMRGEGMKGGGEGREDGEKRKRRREGGAERYESLMRG